MYVLLFSTSVVLAVLLWTVSQKQTSYKRLLKWYSALFVICSLTLGTFTVQKHKDDIRESVQGLWKETSKVQHVSANQKNTEDGTIKNPLIEQYHLKSEVHIDVEAVNQYPELPRGCEVTSLSMLLQHHDYDVDKMTLAKKVQKSEQAYQNIDGQIHFGDPNEGFVGNMYNLSEPGFGVYHKPIAKLTRQYAGDRVIDFSGGSFYEILEHLDDGHPVWIITNTLYQSLPDSYFEQWITPNGTKRITMKEHSVVITGYDQDFMYFNDPLTGKKKKAPKDDFKEAWVQMGKQAITIK
ncbi:MULTISPECIES: C39 family peptidase [Pontibacillus]|uniref:C39 family peptidase n=1 Tax=Pontibacillus chungwhensis TaxID=265426 RepID=A0ABY8UWC8_9BACI|nr:MULTISPECIES: C39 family peptidase [Pontibacillus]MCD5325046.1 C39 family peptidase [Pontibacillus sp. HN14]WIF97302.1 C39 family peptidase [Pontibacillus chungwhensis]